MRNDGKIKQKCFLHAILLIVILLQACTYEPDGDYLLPGVVNDSEPPQIQVINLDLYNDTVFVYFGNTSFKVNSSNQEVELARFLINGEELHSYPQNNDFILNNITLEDGVYELTVELYTGSGTGSIADKIGAEGYMFSKKWTLVVNNSYSEQVSSFVENGVLKIKWPEFKNIEFKEFVVKKDVSGTRELIRGKSTIYTDSTYVGEPATYIIEVNTLDNNTIEWGRIELEKDIPKMHLRITEKNEYILVWSKPKYQAVEYLRLDFQNTQHSAGGYTISNLNDTTYILNHVLSFGDKGIFELKTIPGDGNISYTGEGHMAFKDRKEINIGFPLEGINSSINDLYRINEDEFIYWNRCDSLMKYSINNKEVLSRLSYSTSGCNECKFRDYDLSPQMKYLTNNKACNDEVMLINTETFLIDANHGLTSIQDIATSGIPVSDNGIGVLNINTGGFLLYDLISMQELAKYSESNFASKGMKISSDGKYLLVKDDLLRIVKFENNQFTEIWSSSIVEDISYYNFHPLNSEQIVLLQTGTLIIYNCENLSVTNEIQLNDEKLLHIDFYTNRFLSYYNYQLLVRDLVDGRITETIEINFTPAEMSVDFFLVNNTIINSRGVLYFLN